MPQGRQKSPGSFQDELGGVIERVAPAEPKAPVKCNERHKRRAKDTTNERLFERSWRRAD